MVKIYLAKHPEILANWRPVQSFAEDAADVIVMKRDAEMLGKKASLSVGSRPEP